MTLWISPLLSWKTLKRGECSNKRTHPIVDPFAMKSLPTSNNGDLSNHHSTATMMALPPISAYTTRSAKASLNSNRTAPPCLESTADESSAPHRLVDIPQPDFTWLFAKLIQEMPIVERRIMAAAIIYRPNAVFDQRLCLNSRRCRHHRLYM